MTFTWGDETPEDVLEFKKYVNEFIVVDRVSKNNRFLSLFEMMAYFFSSTPYVIRKYFSKLFAKKIKQLIKASDYQILHFDHLHMAQYVYLSNGRQKCFLDEHNIEYLIWERYLSLEKNILKKILFLVESKKMKAFERSISMRCDLCSVVSKEDENVLKLLSPSAKINVISNGVDVEYFAPIKAEIEPDSLVFTGSMNWLPNENAMLYFCGEIFPLILKKTPSVRLYIVGHNPTHKILRLAVNNQNIIVTGSVDDIRPFIAKASVVIVPLRVGGGTRLKILEAMSMGKAIVSTSIGCEGIDVNDDENIIIADSPAVFSEAILKLFSDVCLRDKLGRAGRKLVCQKYSWSKIYECLNKNYEELVKK